GGELQKIKEELEKIKNETANQWSINGCVYSQSFSVAAQDLEPDSLFFKPDGTKVYVVGVDGDDINEYNLSTPWDISTCVYLQNFSVAAQETSPKGLSFKPGGTKVYIIGIDENNINEYNLSTPWDISTCVYLQNFSVAAQETYPNDLFFKPDGTKVYVVGSTGDDINEYNLSTPWDISTCVYLQNFSVAAQEMTPTDLFFKPDGTKVYVVGVDGDDINEYNLSTPWDISTCVYSQNFSVAAQETSPKGLSFKPDGTKVYVVGSMGDNINEYDVGTYETLPTLREIKQELEKIHEWEDAKATDHIKQVPIYMESDTLHVSADASTDATRTPTSGHRFELMGYILTVHTGNAIVIDAVGTLMVGNSTIPACSFGVTGDDF
ncbi:unnamed protein product, partial [marine sediment metagenome]